MGRRRGETLHKSPNADVLKEIILKLQKRVEAGAGTLLLKVKVHRGDPLHEEADIRAEMGRLKEQTDITLDDPTNRTNFQWTESPGTGDEPQENLSMD